MEALKRSIDAKRTREPNSHLRQTQPHKKAKGSMKTTKITAKKLAEIEEPGNKNTAKKSGSKKADAKKQAKQNKAAGKKTKSKKDTAKQGDSRKTNGEKTAPDRATGKKSPASNVPVQACVTPSTKKRA
ncbi:hypothetical protein [Arthrobacter alpinus]|uniref:hypothetical protein n=1 Tax=Arthrobacter alpinus TaxID=656366 RepID=UPI000A784020